MKNASNRVRATLALSACALLSLTAVACSGEVSDGELVDDSELGSMEQAIIDGQASSLDNVVKVLRGGTLCTGTLLRNDIVLTARHCVGTADGSFPRHSIQTISGATANVSNRSQIEENADADVAVMRLDRPVRFGGSDRYAMTELYAGSLSSLEGSDVVCAGYGIKTCGGSDSGTQRSATLSIESASSTSLLYEPNAQGQLLSSGDSGGPCFRNGQVVGTTRTAGCSEARQTPVPSNADWIKERIADLIDSQAFSNPTVRTSLAQRTPIRWFANSAENARQFCVAQGFADADAAHSRRSAAAGTTFASWSSATGRFEADRINLPVGLYTEIVCRN